MKTASMALGIVGGVLTSVSFILLLLGGIFALVKEKQQYAPLPYPPYPPAPPQA